MEGKLQLLLFCGLGDVIWKPPEKVKGCSFAALSTLNTK
jgi:hypothetical protein